MSKSLAGKAAATPWLCEKLRPLGFNLHGHIKSDLEITLVSLGCLIISLLALRGWFYGTKDEDLYKRLCHFFSKIKPTYSQYVQAKAVKNLRKDCVFQPEKAQQSDIVCWFQKHIFQWFNKMHKTRKIGQNVRNIKKNKNVFDKVY